MSPEDLAYMAAVVDTLGIIRSRRVSASGQVEPTLLPMLALHSTDRAPLDVLADATGTKVTATRRSYSRAGCAEHCAEKHQHIVSASYRWSVTGVKATVVLAAVRPYLRVKGTAADDAIALGLRAPRKAATPGRMAALGWPLPEAYGVSPSN